MGSLWENSSYDCEITAVGLNSLPVTHIVAQKLDILLIPRIDCLHVKNNFYQRWAITEYD